MVCIGVPVFEDNEPQARSAIAFSMVKASAKPFSTDLTSKLTRLATTVSRRLGRPGPDDLTRRGGRERPRGPGRVTGPGGAAGR